MIKCTHAQRVFVEGWKELGRKKDIKGREHLSFATGGGVIASSFSSFSSFFFFLRLSLHIRVFPALKGKGLKSCQNGDQN